MRSKTHRAALLILTVLVLLTSSLAHADNIYVSCYNSGKIMKYDSSGNGTIFASGLNNPTGLAFDSKGNLWASEQGSSNTNNGAIVKFDKNGNKSTFVSMIHTPQGLAFDSSGTLFAAKFLLDRIDKYDSSGYNTVFVDLFGSHAYPEDLVFDNSGNLWVSSYYGMPEYSKIFKINPSGNMTVFSQGNDPIGLAFDRNGYLFAANYYNGTISKYDSSGNETIFASGLNQPHGLEFDSSGYLYVSDGYGEILKYDSSGYRTIFASGLSNPLFIATQIPEPATLLFLGLGGLALRKRKA
jgi:sugar lactone lactonase YvrE